MSLSFFNPYLLFGLIGIGLPILIHLLSRKNVKVIEWGAMQFLELGQRTRRKYQLEHLLLLLLRILLISLICLALARPWLSGMLLFSPETKRDPRALVIVLDHSFSMDRRDLPQTPWIQAEAIVNQVMGDVRPGDQFYLLSAQDVPVPLLPGWTTEPDRISSALAEYPSPAGSSNLPLALVHALQQFQEVNQAQREILILTDNQTASWRVEDKKTWQRLENLFEITPNPPRLWSLPLTDFQSSETPVTNSGLEPPQLSREFVLRGRPVQIRTTARHWGTEPVTRTVHLSVDGQRLQQQTREITLSPDSSTSLSFDYVPTTEGSHLIQVEWEADNLPGDDRVQTVLNVRPQVTMLFIEKRTESDPTKSESFYLSAALSPPATAENQNLVQLSIQQEFPDEPDSC
ncbi:MAG: BatA domain-containing protein [Planctomycetaceae bacterium]